MWTNPGLRKWMRSELRGEGERKREEGKARLVSCYGREGQKEEKEKGKQHSDTLLGGCWRTTGRSLCFDLYRNASNWTSPDQPWLFRPDLRTRPLSSLCSWETLKPSPGRRTRVWVRASSSLGSPSWDGSLRYVATYFEPYLYQLGRDMVKP